MLFKTGYPAIDNYDFLKKVGTLYDLFYDLISEKISIKKAAIEQNEMITKIEELKNFISSKEKASRAINKRGTKTPPKEDLNNTKKCFK